MLISGFRSGSCFLSFSFRHNLVTHFFWCWSQTHHCVLFFSLSPWLLSLISFTLSLHMSFEYFVFCYFECLVYMHAPFPASLFHYFPLQWTCACLLLWELFYACMCCMYIWTHAHVCKCLSIHLTVYVSTGSSLAVLLFLPLLSFPLHQSLINLRHVQSLGLCSGWDQVNLWNGDNIS